jgi:hypothetical protein
MMTPNKLIRIEKYFPNNFPDDLIENIHIIVVVSTIGKYLPMFYLSNKKFIVETMIHILVVTFVNMLSRSPLELGRKRLITEEVESKKRVIETWYHT